MVVESRTASQLILERWAIYYEIIYNVQGSVGWTQHATFNEWAMPGLL